MHHIFETYQYLQVFRVFDTDKGGRLNFREFVTALSVMQKGDLDQRLKWAFALYDIRGTGTLTKDELLEITDVSCMLLCIFFSPSTYVQSHFYFKNHHYFISNFKCICTIGFLFQKSF